MPVISVRGRLRLLVKDEAGEWRQRALGLADVPENWPRAEAKLREVERAMDAIRRNAPAGSGVVTVESWGTRWLLTRTNRDAENDASRLRLHVFPVIGSLPLAEVEPRHVNALQKTWDKAPRTRRNIYSVLQAMFRDAEIEGLVPRGQNPCILTHRQMGTIADSPAFIRHEHVFTRDELEALISDERVPQDRRVWYALLGVGMVRVGEAAGLRWGRVLACEPLGRMIVSHSYEGTTKTGNPRWMPIHPVLAGILAEWRLGGWARTFGRPPLPDDLVCPVPPEPPRKGKRKEPGSMRDKNWCRKRIVLDLVTLEIRHRRAHDLRRTGISLATSDGAIESMLNRGTHAPPNKVMDLYITPEWEALCREVGKLRIARKSNAGRESR